MARARVRIGPTIVKTHTRDIKPGPGVRKGTIQAHRRSGYTKMVPVAKGRGKPIF